MVLDLRSWPCGCIRVASRGIWDASGCIRDASGVHRGGIKDALRSSWYALGMHEWTTRRSSMKTAAGSAVVTAAGAAVRTAETTERAAVRPAPRTTVRAASRTVLIAVQDHRQGVRVRSGSSAKFEL